MDPWESYPPVRSVSFRDGGCGLKFTDDKLSEAEKLVSFREGAVD